MCFLNGNISEEVFCDVLDNGLILRLKFFIREGPGKTFSKFLNPDLLKLSHSPLHFQKE